MPAPEVVLVGPVTKDFLVPAVFMTSTVINTFTLSTHLMTTHTVLLVQPQEPPSTAHGKSHIAPIFIAFYSNPQRKGMKIPLYFLLRGRLAIFFPPTVYTH